MARVQKNRGLIAAYREGLGLSCITIIRDAQGLRVSAIAPGDSELDPKSDVRARWWCRRAADAKRIATAATARLRRRRPGEGAHSAAELACEHSDLLSQTCGALLAAARRHNVVLQSDDEMAKEALRFAAHVEAKVKGLQKSGGLRSVNRAYRDYRLEANARGERAMPYNDWMQKYLEDLVREAARALRDI
jgi:hypothetical protein